LGLNVVDPASPIDVTSSLPDENESAGIDSPHWEYSETADKVRGATTYIAGLESLNSVNLAPPYDGGSTVRLSVRKHPEWGTDVYFRLSSGQLLCNSYSGCYATVRFDDRAAERFNLNEPSDNSSDMVFVQGSTRFIRELKRSKHVVVELEIYEGGRPQFEFDVAGLKWDH